MRLMKIASRVGVIFWYIQVEPSGPAEPPVSVFFAMIFYFAA